MKKLFNFELQNKHQGAIVHFLVLGLFFAFLSATIFSYKGSNPLLIGLINSLMVVYEMTFLQFALVVVAIFMFINKQGTSKGVILGAIYGVLASVLQIGIYFFIIGFAIINLTINFYNKRKKQEETENSNLKIEYLVYVLLIIIVLSAISFLNQFVSYSLGDFIYSSPNSLLSVLVAVFMYIFGLLGAFNLLVETIAFQTNVDTSFLQTSVIAINLSIFFTLLSKIVLARKELSYEAKRTITIASLSTLLFYHVAYLLIIIKKPFNFLITAFAASSISVLILYFTALDFTSLYESFATGKPLSILHFMFNFNHIVQTIILLVITLFAGTFTTFASFLICKKLCKCNCKQNSLEASEK